MSLSSLVYAVLGGSEFLIIIAVIIILLIWGPNQLPKLARALGQAKKEFQKAQEEEEKKQESSE